MEATPRPAFASASPEVSACIVNWNGGEHLRALLRSLREAARETALEVIVVDNASEDGSPGDVARELPDAILVSNDRNAGFARACNQAAARASGRLLFFLNNDTVVRPGALASLVGFLDSNRDISAVGPRLIGADGLAQHSTRNLPELGALFHRLRLLRWTGIFRAADRRFRRAGEPADGGRVGHLAAAALLLRRDQLAAIGGWDEGFEFGVEDLDLSSRLGRLGALYFLPQAEVEHLGRVSTRARRAYAYAAFEMGFARYVRKHHGPWAGRLYKALVAADLPLRGILLGARWAGQRLRGRPDRARKSAAELRAASSLLFRGLGRYLRS